MTTQRTSQPPLNVTWHQRPGLAGGIDYDGSRAVELLSLGFGSVEFGSMQAQAMPAVLARLRAARSATSTVSAIGVGLGLAADMQPAALGAQWCLGVRCIMDCTGAVDYLSLNLSAAANRRFVTPELRGALDSALAQCAPLWAAWSIPVAIKLPIDDALRLSSVWSYAKVAQLTVVLSSGGTLGARNHDLATLALLRKSIGGVRIVAVGGIRSAADVAAVRAAGADGVQVHRLFTQHGSNCMAMLGMNYAVDCGAGYGVGCRKS